MQAVFVRALKKATAVVAVVVACAAPRSVEAQQPAGGLLPTLTTDPKTLKPGTWVKYSIYSPRTGQAILTRITALEQEGKGQWLEIAITNPRRQTLVIKSLVQGSLARPGPLLETVIQPPGHQPLLLPARLARGQVPELRAGAAPPGAKLVGRTRLTVAAGTFTARHYRGGRAGATAEIWLSDEVPGWPMIKARTPELLLELAGHGASGRSQVRGKPGKLDERTLKQLGLMP